MIPMTLAVIIPVYNEQEILEQTISTLKGCLKHISHSLVFVDDGSTDSSWHILESVAKKTPHMHCIKLSRNFGHQSAYTAGLSAVDAEHYAMIDCDLQDPPELITIMLNQLVESNVSVVYGQRSERKEFILKRALFSSFHYVFSKISSTQFPRNVGNFCVMTRQVRDAMLTYHEHHRYLPGLRYFAGFTQIPYVYARKKRIGGSAKMSVSKLMNLGIDAIFSFTDVPIKVFWYVGLLGFLTSVGIAFKIVFDKLVYNTAILGWASTIGVIVFFASLQLLLLAVLGKYVYNIYDEVRNRPLFTIERHIKSKSK